MCGRFTIVPTVDFHERFGLPEGPAIGPRYNVAPGQEAPVIVRSDGNQLVPMTWGFIAPFVQNPAAGRPVINARAETLLEKPSFRSAVQERRCLVPASGFYEWKKEGQRKVPFSAIPSGEHDDFLKDIGAVVSALGKAGMARVLVADLTRPEIGVPVVRVLVPGLEVYAMDNERIGARCRDAERRRLSRPQP
jgi:hypothetical protein